MYDDYNPEKDRQDVGHLIVGIIIGLWALFLMTMCSSCTTTKYVSVPEYHTDTLIQTKIVKDSVYLKDSTHVSEKNDTVKIEHWHTEFLKKEVHDTIYISKTDSVPAPYPVEVIMEVPAELSMWELLKMKAGGIAILLCIFAFLFWIWRSK